MDCRSSNVYGTAQLCQTLALVTAKRWLNNGTSLWNRNEDYKNNLKVKNSKNKFKITDYKKQKNKFISSFSFARRGAKRECKFLRINHYCAKCILNLENLLIFCRNLKKRFLLEYIHTGMHRKRVSWCLLVSKSFTESVILKKQITNLSKNSVNILN
jgi:hypothetical protein